MKELSIVPCSSWLGPRNRPGAKDHRSSGAYPHRAGRGVGADEEWVNPSRLVPITCVESWRQDEVFSVVRNSAEHVFYMIHQSLRTANHGQRPNLPTNSAKAASCLGF